MPLHLFKDCDINLIFGKIIQMKVEVVTIGDEILIGQITDTNSQWIGRQLNKNGFYSQQFTSVGDDSELILRSLSLAAQNADIILITGGLGPTKDDITKKALCDFFDSELVLNREVLDKLQKYYSRRGIQISKEVENQALLPDNCSIIPNNQGSASGMWFENKGKVYVSMPGVPYEMKEMMREEIIPRLRSKFKTTEIRHRTVLTQGIGESKLEEMITDWVQALPTHIRVSYLPAVGRVRLRLSGAAEKGIIEEIDKQIAELLPLIGPYHYGFDDDRLEAVLGELLRSKSSTLAVAESCTGGYLSHLITSIPGSSDYFLGSAVTYHNSLKSNWIGVGEDVLSRYGAVSRETVEAMARGVRRESNADYAISTSGIAGPGGGSEEKPVGTVWLGFSSAEGERSHLLQLGVNRLRNIEISALTAMNMMRNIILQQESDSA